MTLDSLKSSNSLNKLLDVNAKVNPTHKRKNPM